MYNGVEYGETREYGNFSFTRIYESRHEIPFYQRAYPGQSSSSIHRDMLTQCHTEQPRLHSLSFIAPSLARTFLQARRRSQRSLGAQVLRKRHIRRSRRHTIAFQAFEGGTPKLRLRVTVPRTTFHLQVHLLPLERLILEVLLIWCEAKKISRIRMRSSIVNV
jgi:hypothetical protein